MKKAKPKNKIMQEMRERRESEGLVRREVWVHESQLEALAKSEKRLRKPKVD